MLPNALDCASSFDNIFDVFVAETSRIENFYLNIHAQLFVHFCALFSHLRCLKNCLYIGFFFISSLIIQRSKCQFVKFLLQFVFK